MHGFALSVAVVFFLLAAMRSWFVAKADLGLDFYHFFAVPAAVRIGGVRDVYSPAGRDEFFAYMHGNWERFQSRRLTAALNSWTRAEPTATPLQYSAFAAASSGSYENDYRRFQAASFALGTLGLLLLGQLLRVPLTAMLVVCATVALCFEPWLYDAALANVNRLMLFGFVAYLALRFSAFRHPQQAAWSVASGFVLGFVILFKPLLALAPLTLGLNRLVRHRHRDLVYELTGGLLAVFVALAFTWALFGTPRAWIDWATYVPDMLSEHSPGPGQGNYAPGRWLADVFGTGAFALCAATALGLVLAQFMVLRRDRDESPDADRLAHEDVAALGLALLLCFWLSPQIWMHYYVLTLPSLLFVLVLAWRAKAVVSAALAVAAAVAFHLAVPALVVMGVAALGGALLLVLRLPPTSGAVAAHAAFR